MHAFRYHAQKEFVGNLNPFCRYQQKFTRFWNTRDYVEIRLNHDEPFLFLVRIQQSLAKRKADAKFDGEFE